MSMYVYYVRIQALMQITREHLVNSLSRVIKTIKENNVKGFKVRPDTFDYMYNLERIIPDILDDLLSRNYTSRKFINSLVSDPNYIRQLLKDVDKELYYNCSLEHLNNLSNLMIYTFQISENRDAIVEE